MNQPENACGETAYVNVSVATLWSKPNVNRPIDEPSITNPVHPWKWTQSMTLDEKLWLVGKLETQALLGNEVTILETQGEWANVLVHHQITPKNGTGYPGWIPYVQLAHSPLFEEGKKSPFVLITQPTTFLYASPLLNEEVLEISFNTRLPLLEKSIHYKVLLPNGYPAWIRREDGRAYPTVADIPPPTGSDLVNTAKMFLGLPYLWSGTSGFGFDCSGFTFSIYQAHGIHIPRDASPQSKVGESVQREALQLGDLLFFQNKGKVTHVTMYAGDGLMIHAPESAKCIELIPVDSLNHTKTYAGARRILV